MASNQDLSLFIKELLNDQRHNQLEKILSNKCLINIKMLIQDFSLLTDIFLKEIDYTGLAKYFNKFTWKSDKTF